ncbi:hypothetical protein DXG01_015566 [Tephrocybe rancida]|nr:hypothetical protein DXG01_015566 [Tephrocybe rancida]
MAKKNRLDAVLDEADDNPSVPLISRLVQPIAHLPLHDDHATWKRTHDRVQRIVDKLVAKSEGYRGGKILIRGLDYDQDDVVEGVVSRWSIHHNAASFMSWGYVLDKKVTKEFKKQYKSVRQVFMQRMTRLGYQECDIQAAISTGGLSSHLPGHDILCILDWVTLKPKLCQAVEKQLAIRKRDEREILIQSRIDSVQELYGQKFATLSFDDQNTLPEPKDIGLYDHFTELIHSSHDDPLPRSNITKKVDCFIERWPPTTFSEFASLCSSKQKLPASHAHLDGHYTLDSASFVFICTTCHRSESIPSSECVIGWQATISHLRCVEYADMGPLELSERGCAAAVALLDHLGLDPRTTRPAELDECRLSFACEPCMTRRGRSTSLSWRDAIHHFIIERHGVPKWKTLSSEDIKVMQPLQAWDDSEEVDTWSSIADMF